MTLLRAKIPKEKGIFCKEYLGIFLYSGYRVEVMCLYLNVCVCVCVCI